jgi:hypothetical protein
MNIRHGVFWSVVAIAALPRWGLAAESREEIGALQAVFNFCATHDPSHAKEYEKQGDTWTHGLTLQQLLEIRASAAYKDAYRSLGVALGELPDDAATIHACEAILGAPNNKAHRP